MALESTLTKLEEVLRQEREAIVRFDAAELDRRTNEKLALLAELREGPPPGPDHAARYEAVRDALRHNLALLSHGRACLREAIATFTQGRADPTGPARPGIRIHVTG